MLLTKIDAPMPIVWSGAEGDRVAPEGFTNTKPSPAIGEFALGLHLAHDIRSPILNGWQGFGKWTGAGLMARGGDGQRQGFVGPFEIVLIAPVIKVLLTVGQVLKLALVEQFGFEGAMKAFVFAQGLRMRGAGMANPDAQADTPDGQGREGAPGPIAPRGAVIHEQAQGQPIAPEGGAQVGLDGGGLFIGTGLETQGKAGTIIQDGEGVTAPRAEGKMALEIHLPQRIRRGVFEALPGRWRPCGGRETAVPPQNRGNGTGGRDRLIAKGLQASVQLPSAPGRIGGAEVENGMFHRCVRALGHPVGAPGLILQALSAGGRIAGQPFIRRGGTDPKAPTEGTQGEAGLVG